MAKLKEYEPIVGKEVLRELELFAGKLEGVKVQHINSTPVGGGVAEILVHMVPLLRELGVDTGWDVIKGGEKFFEITKKMHNALHGQEASFTPEELELFLETNELNAREIDWKGDIILIHDPQPIALVKRKKDLERKWVWRCHIDISRHDPFTFNFIKEYIEQYDACIFSAPAFSQKLNIPQILISPSIDPLSEKNRELTPEEIDQVLEKFHIDKKRPLVTQISRFDRLKDPVGVIKVFRQVRKYLDCQLVLAGGGAADDPEGAQVLAEVKEAAKDDPDIFLLFLPLSSDLEINALQRASTVILQKSIREGFGLTVAEALWKGKPVIAGAVGGIPLQITHQHSGILSRTIEGTAFALKQLLQNPDYAKRLGENGREHIRKHFLITRNLRDYLLLFLSLNHQGENVIHL